MKPHPRLGILYICSYLRQKDVNAGTALISPVTA